MKLTVLCLLLIVAVTQAQKTNDTSSTQAPTKGKTTVTKATPSTKKTDPTTAKTTAPPKTTKKTTVTAKTTKKTTVTAKTTKKTTAKPKTTKKTTAKPTTTKKTTVKPTTTKKTTAKPTTTKKTTAKPTTTKTTVKPTTKPTTAKPTTTVTTQKPTTAKPTTKATTAKATTAKATTAKATTAKATTAKATTAKASTIIVTTSSAPTVVPVTTPSPFELHYAVKNKAGVDCLSLSGVISVTVGEEVINLEQSKCKSSGKCSALGNETAEIDLTCSQPDKQGMSNAIEITKLNIGFKGSDVWYMSSIKVNHSGIVGSATYKENANDKLFQAQKNHSYTCAEEHKLTLGAQNISLVVDFKKVTMQPFAGKGVQAVVCPSGVNPNPDSSIVPIAVGCALAGLIVIVLIAYLIGRRKGGNRGYQKV